MTTPDFIPKKGELYTHHTGQTYRVIGLAKLTAGERIVVVYCPAYLRFNENGSPRVEDGAELFVRPLDGPDGWTTRRVDTNGSKHARFVRYEPVL
jgi:hypothetical protein